MMQDIEMMKRYGLLPEGFDDWEEDDLEEEPDFLKFMFPLRPWIWRCGVWPDRTSYGTSHPVGLWVKTTAEKLLRHWDTKFSCN